MSDIISDYKTQGEWRIQLTIAINFIPSKYKHSTHTMHSKSDKTEIVQGNEIGKTIEQPFESLWQKYQSCLEERIRSEFIFDSVDLLY